MSDSNFDAINETLASAAAEPAMSRAEMLGALQGVSESLQETNAAIDDISAQIETTGARIEEIERRIESIDASGKKSHVIEITTLALAALTFAFTAGPEMLKFIRLVIRDFFS